MLDDLVTFRSSAGEYTLARPLATGERRMIEGRRNQIMDSVAAARPGFITDCVLQMLIGFGGAKIELAEAQAIAAQYASVLAGLPAWAVREACDRWSKGHVTADEIGERSINRAFAPSAAHVRMTAERAMLPSVQEVARLNKTLRGTPERLMTDEEKAAGAPRVEAGLKAAKDILDAASAAEDAKERESAAQWGATVTESGKQMIVDEYRAQGIEPPPGPLISLSLRKTLGWKITEGENGEPVLALPSKPKRKTRADYGA